VEQIILLILFLALPGLIRKLAGQKRGAPKKARPAASRPTAEAPVEQEEQLPDWLRKLSETLSERGEQIGGELGETLRNLNGEDAVEEELVIESVPVSSTVDWEAVPIPDPPERDHSSHIGQVAAPPRRELHGDRKAGRYVPSGRSEWRKAVILSEVLGAPRGLKPWREAGGES
jgi:hypothetical protein